MVVVIEEPEGNSVDPFGYCVDIEETEVGVIICSCQQKKRNLLHVQANWTRHKNIVITFLHALCHEV